MRLLFPIVILAFASQSASAQRPKLVSPHCPTVSSHLADKGGARRGDPAKPRKLGELPPADAYAAVYVLDERGCTVPVKYPSGRR